MNSSLVLRVDDGSALHRQAAKIHTKIIRNFAVVGHVKRREVGIFANLERADAIVLAKGIGGINGRGGDGLGGSHAHLRAGEREDHRHAERGTGAGIEIGGQCRRWLRRRSACAPERNARGPR